MKTTAMIMAAAALALAGCAEKPKIEECWSPDAKRIVKTMTEDGIVRQLKEETRSGPFDEQAFRKSLSVEVNAFIVTDWNQTGALKCEAEARATITRGDGSILRGGPRALPFGVYPAEEKGPVYQIPTGLTFNSLIRDMEQSARQIDASAAK
ncbi:hypothetical protein [Chromobacterium violaceum]|uniref:hypothetical protein n=1 Tax=Chromobacterium violaceum TaxID=536 RepID=UPI0005BA0E5A|nr:hypothetical protein [Chromobacterium violaceum]